MDWQLEIAFIWMMMPLILLASVILTIPVMVVITIFKAIRGDFDDPIPETQTSDLLPPLPEDFHESEVLEGCANRVEDMPVLSELEGAVA